VNSMSSDRFGTSANYKQQEKGYRDRALKLFPWVCGRCARAFEYSNLKELTVHHVDHDHTNNPNDGSNWELLCIYCHDNEHDKYTKHAEYRTEVVAGDHNQDTATHNPFADLKAMLKK
jgi:5-methylcytosine-specific restriction endonuclease McrA